MNFDIFYSTTGVSTDTRNIQKDCLFICLKGVNFNGNEFAQKALDAGAKYVVIDELLVPDNPAFIHVENSLNYLQKLANYHRNKFDIPVIGITGSNGKTTTKELLAAVLLTKYSVLYTLGNLNNHIGVPLTLLRLTSEHEIAIIEMGANKFKDIEELSLIAEPTHGIITNIGSAHLEGFGSFEGVLKTKLELYQAIEKKKGVLFYNADDAILVDNLPKNIQTIAYASNQKEYLTGTLLEMTPFVKMKWRTENYESDPIQTQLIGKYNFYNFLAAISFGVYFDVASDLISKALSEYTPTNNRSQLTKTETNTLIMDAYNANPTSMSSALESFAMMEENNKSIILGDMFELGKDSKMEHQKIIDLIKKLDLSAICVGKIFHELIANNIGTHIIAFQSKEEAGEYLQNHPIKNQLILLKGSRGIGLETMVPLL
ncbi:MAG: UDP-N-acetylmuramoyl-tripeptide--D-alanyl-D-alanine ligase [Crocinitomicaceae bacterium]|nr:UDP-N-acetylmuramoyl-tripeptide--D-alanyl-D-alanine ligase [Crocinitomicaceae bacterium]